MKGSFKVATGARTDFIDITSQVQLVISESGASQGICSVFVPHTTAGITINENADPDVRQDIMKTLDKMVPWHNDYHHCEGNSAAHIKASLMGFSVTVPVYDSRLLLGTWQCIYFCEFDGPRTRTVTVTVSNG